MSLIQILNYSQKKEFETPPLLEYEIRSKQHTGVKSDKEI